MVCGTTLREMPPDMGRKFKAMRGVVREDSPGKNILLVLWKHQQPLRQAKLN